MDQWREGPARLFDPADECPLCLVKGECFASDFSIRLAGKHKIRACSACQKVTDNGKEKGPLTVHERKAP